MGILRGADCRRGRSGAAERRGSHGDRRVRSTEDPGLFRKSSNRCRRASAPTPTPLGLLAAQGTSRLRLALGLTRVLEAAASPGEARYDARGEVRQPTCHALRCAAREKKSRR